MWIKNKKNIIIISSLMVVLVILAVVLPLVLIEREDLVPPTIEITNPSNGEILRNEVTIECAINDTGTAISDLKFELYIDSIFLTNETSYLWDTNMEDDGHYLIEAYVYDQNLNFAYQNITVTIDNTIENPPNDQFKILNYNIKESGIGEGWKEVVKKENADIIVFVETGDWDNKGSKKLLQSINEFNAYFYEEAPYEGYTAQSVQYETSGEAILSRYPILEFNQIPIVTLDDNTSYDVTHDFVHAVIDVYGTTINVIGNHLKAGVNTSFCNLDEDPSDCNTYRREREQEGINNYMDDLGDVPIMYVGDLNSLSPVDNNPELEGDPGADFGYGPVTMLLNSSDPKYGNYTCEKHNFTDVFRTLHPHDPGHTLNIPTIVSRIDFIFVNQFFNEALISSNIGSGSEYDETGSDHFSLDAVIEINNITYSPLIQSKQIEIESCQEEIKFNISKLSFSERKIKCHQFFVSEALIFSKRRGFFLSFS